MSKNTETEKEMLYDLIPDFVLPALEIMNII